METWDKELNDFGKVEGDKILLTYFYYLGSKKIKEIEVTCNCVNTTFVDNKLQVKWIPKKKKRPYVSSKNILIVYEDDTIDDLEIKAEFK